jgi:ElaB/YqjD/DUF883 family membrane-anchored ribosome-binding protein
MAGQDASQKDTAEIRREIEQTRQRLDVTLSELETKLNPGRLKRQATDAIRENTVGRVEEFADNARESMKGVSADVFETIKENPIPAALAAIGLGWLMMERRSGNRNWQYRGDYRYDRGYRYNRYERYPQFEGREYRYGDRYTDFDRGANRGMADKARETTSQIQDKAQDVAGQIGDKAQQVTDQAQMQISEWADTAQEKAGRFRSRFEEVLDENPLLIGAAALALGAAIGLSLPETRKEDELMGTMRDDLMEKAQSTAQDTMQKVQNVAEKAGDAAQQAAKDEAQKQNLPAS